MLSTLLACIAGLSLGATEAASGGSFWFPVQGSTNAAEVDWLFDFILYISVFFFVLIVGLVAVFVYRYRSRPGVEAERTATHHTPLELLWTIVPTILVIIIFYFGLNGYIDTRSPPRNAREVLVTGQKWSWSFTYPNGTIDADLHVPVGEPTRLVLRSEDVLHSFFVPAFRMKMDVVPGRYGKVWFTPVAAGEYQVFCAEYCGQNHSGMLTKVIVHEPGGFEKWLRDVEEKNMNKSPVELGAGLYKTRGCMQCHSIDGTPGIAPSFKGIYGEMQALADGKSVKVDEDYIHESIIEPQAKIVRGYAPVMPTFKGKLKDKEIAGIIEFIKSLK